MYRAAIVTAIIVGLSKASAQTPATPSSEPVKTVVTVTATPVESDRSTGDTTVVEPAPATNPQSMADLLRSQPSVYVSQPGVRGGPTSVSLRGGDANFTLLLLDGLPVNDITDQLGGAADLSSVLPFDIDRVEIVRGPLSAVYGSETVSGVINVISRAPEAPYARLRVVGGNFGTFESRFTTGGQKGKLQYSAGIGGVRVGEQIERDFYKAVDSGGRISWRITGAGSLSATVRLRHSDSAGFPASSGGPLYALNRKVENRTGTSGIGGLEWKHAGGRYTHRASFDAFRQLQDQDTPAVLDRIPPTFRSVPATRASTEFLRSRLNASSSRRLKGGWVTTAGMNYRHESGTNVGAIDIFGPANFSLTRNTFAPFGEVLRDGRWWSVAAGVRSDWVSGGVRRTNPRVGASVLIPRALTRVRASWGRAFKMPSFYALAQPFIGNAKLRPETSQSVDLSVEQPTRVGVLRATLYHSAYRDLVDFSPQQFRLVNRSEALAKGVDLAWTLQVKRRFLMQTHANYVSLRLKNSAEVLRDRPKWRTGMTASGTMAGIDFYAEALWVASRFDFQLPVPRLNRAPSYFVTNLGAQRQLSSRATAFVRLDNVLNRKYFEYVGFMNPGVSVRGGIDFTLW